jgi:hypothetical protein
MYDITSLAFQFVMVSSLSYEVARRTRGKRLFYKNRDNIVTFLKVLLLVIVCGVADDFWTMLRLSVSTWFVNTYQWYLFTSFSVVWVFCYKPRVHGHHRWWGRRERTEFQEESNGTRGTLRGLCHATHNVFDSFLFIPVQDVGGRTPSPWHGMPLLDQHATLS